MVLTPKEQVEKATVNPITTERGSDAAGGVERGGFLRRAINLGTEGRMEACNIAPGMDEGCAPSGGAPQDQTAAMTCPKALSKLGTGHG